MDAIELGQEILKLRKQKGMTQEDLAFKTGLSVRTVQRIENGEVDARTYTLNLLAEALGVEIEYFTLGLEQQESHLKRQENYRKKWHFILHISGFFVLLLPPLIIWVWKRDEVDELDQHGRDVVNFQLSMWIYLFALALPPVIAVGIFVLPLIGLLSSILVIYNALRVLNGNSYYYPLAIRFLKSNKQHDVQVSTSEES